MSNVSSVLPVTSELDLLGQVLSEHPSLGNVGIFLIGIAVVGRILIQLGLSLRCHRRSQQHLAPLDQI
nr:XP [Reverse genetics vector pMLB2]